MLSGKGRLDIGRDGPVRMNVSLLTIQQRDELGMENRIQESIMHGFMRGTV